MSAEYVDDLPYVRHFIADLAPSRLRLVAALNGFTPPPIDDFDYLELGCAHGDTLMALAAAHPEARFLGVDIVADHVRSAKQLARDGGLENVGVLERDLADLIDDEHVGPFDYVVAHGLLSWVSPEKRAAIVALARAKLKPGGLLYVSYNAMPGWSGVEPLRQLLLFGAEAFGARALGDADADTAASSTLARAKRGVELAEAMKAAGADFFEESPGAVEMLEKARAAGLAYVAHEYLHEHWVPMYFARVAAEMAAAGLGFAGSLPPFLNFRDLAVSAEQEKLLSSIVLPTDRISFESLKDFAVNQFFRADVYVKGGASRAADAMDAFLDTTSLGTLAGGPPSNRVVKFPHREARIEGAAIDAVFEAVLQGAAPFPELVERAAGVAHAELRAAATKLLVCEQIVPMTARTKGGAMGADRRFRVPLAYNETMLRRLAPDAPVVMVSTAAGSAFPIGALEGLALRMLVEAAPADRERWAADLVSRSVLRMRIGDRVLESPDDQRRAIQATYEKLEGGRLGKLVELGIVIPA